MLCEWEDMALHIYPPNTLPYMTTTGSFTAIYSLPVPNGETSPEKLLLSLCETTISFTFKENFLTIYAPASM